MVKETAEEILYRGTGEACDILVWAMEKFYPNIMLACSFSPEDTVLVHMLSTIRADSGVFAIDTGRLNEETYQCADAISATLGLKIKWFFPEFAAVQKLESEKGLFSFRNNLENRHECCQIRKVEPLHRALGGLSAWITGLRKDQGTTRTELKSVERDELHNGIIKVNPLLNWSDEDVWGYVKKHSLPHNVLFDKGYTSIGCAPCTRAIEAGEDSRAGRWWWENPEHKECGLHVAS